MESKKCVIGILDAACKEGIERAAQMMWGITRGTEVERDQDHRSVLIHTVKGWLENRDEPPEAAFEHAEKLVKLGANFIVIPRELPYGVRKRFAEKTGKEILNFSPDIRYSKGEGGKRNKLIHPGPSNLVELNLIKKTIKKASDVEAYPNFKGREPSIDIRNKLPPTEAIIGVLGGMGPYPTADFLDKISGRMKPGTEIRELLVHSTPSEIPDRTAAISDAVSKEQGRENNEMCRAVEKSLTQKVKELRAGQASLVVMLCNTAHTWAKPIKEILENRQSNFLHIADAGIQELQRRGIGSGTAVGICATDGTRYADVYTESLKDKKIARIYPTNKGQEKVMNAIYGNIKAGKFAEARSNFEPIVTKLFEQGCEAVFLSCTELPLAVEDEGLRKKCVDPMDALAEACVRGFTGEDLKAHIKSGPVERKGMHRSASAPVFTRGSR